MADAFGSREVRYRPADFGCFDFTENSTRHFGPLPPARPNSRRPKCQATYVYRAPMVYLAGASGRRQRGGSMVIGRL